MKEEVYLGKKNSLRRRRESCGLCYGFLPLDQVKQIIKQQHLTDQRLRKSSFLDVGVCVCIFVRFSVCSAKQAMILRRRVVCVGRLGKTHEWKDIDFSPLRVRWENPS